MGEGRHGRSGFLLATCIMAALGMADTVFVANEFLDALLHLVAEYVAADLRFGGTGGETLGFAHHGVGHILHGAVEAHVIVGREGKCRIGVEAAMQLAARFDLGEVVQLGMLGRDGLVSILPGFGEKLFESGQHGHLMLVVIRTGVIVVGVAVFDFVGPFLLGLLGDAARPARDLGIEAVTQHYFFRFYHRICHARIIPSALVADCEGFVTMPRAQRLLDEATRQHFPLFLRRVVATTSPAASYAHNWHIDAIAEYLAACASGQVRRLIINIPPRMLKSTMVSVAWPAWLLAQDARMRLMVASYAQSLSTKHSTDCRHVMQSAWYRRVFPKTVLSDDQNEKDKFVTTARGHRIAVSVGGSAIGEGGHILIADDPLNPLQASQRAARDAANAWFDHSFATRLDDKQRGAIVIVMQRLHVDDLSGYLQRKGGWEQLCLPAMAPERTFIQCGGFSHMREAGEALHAAREPIALLEATRRELGSANFAAQYQQQPVSEQGSLIRREWFARSDAGVHGRVVQSWDTGIKAGAQHDASACVTIIQQDGMHHVMDVAEMRLEYPELKRRMVAHAERFAAEVILVEDKASGQSLLQDLRRETDLPFVAQLPQGDKWARLVRVSPLIEAGKVALPTDAPWLAGFLTQLMEFPQGTHDDMVDAFSQYLNWVRAQQHGSVPGMRRL